MRFFAFSITILLRRLSLQHLLPHRRLRDGYEPTRKPTSGGYAPTYKPTRKPSGECEDDETWEYLAGDKGYKRCDHVAKKPDPRCGRVSDDGVVASVACPKACGRCD